MKRFVLVIIAAGTAALPIGVGLTGAYATPSAARSTTVKTAHSGIGRIVVGSTGRTVYLFEADRRGRSACSGACAAVWPPLLTTGRPHAANGARASLLGVTRRADGRRQVTYAKHPLYYYAGDTRPGQTNGQGLNQFGAKWYVLSARGRKIDDD